MRHDETADVDESALRREFAKRLPGVASRLPVVIRRVFDWIAVKVDPHCRQASARFSWALKWEG
jgi:hypothetical protein